MRQRGLPDSYIDSEGNAIGICNGTGDGPTLLIAAHLDACIEDPVVIEKILNHLKAKEANDVSPITRLPPPRAPPLLPMWEQGLAD